MEKVVAMKFLVTGGTGFIGACVVRNLLARGIPVVIGEATPDEDVADDLKGADMMAMDIADERAIAAVFENPLAGKAAGADLKPLIDYSLELGASLTKTALATLGANPAQLRAYTKAAVVGIGGDLEHGAAMIHPRLGMAMRRSIKRGRVIIPGHAKVGPPGTAVDLIYGPLDDGWDLDAFDSTPVLIHDAPRPQEIVLWLGYATGPRVNARCKGPDQKEVDALVASFNA